MMRLAKLGTGVLTVILVAACAGTQLRPLPPNVNIADLRLESLTLFEQTFEVKLRLQNPNDFEIPISGLQYTVYLNDKRLASGVSAEPVILPAYGSEIIVTELTSSSLTLVNQFGNLSNIIGKSLNYTVKGSVKLKRGGRKLSFERSGSVTPRREKEPGV